MSTDNGRCMSNGCIFCYDACDCGHCICCCLSEIDCLCYRESCCLACNAKPRDCGCCVQSRDRGEICKIGCFCCDVGLVYPTKLCACASQYWCCTSVASFPWSKEYVKAPVLAWCFLQCCPKCGCCIPPPDCPALDQIQAGDMGPVAPASVVMMDRPGTKSVTESTIPNGSKKGTATVVNVY